MTYKEIVYMIMDELKLSSSDSFFNEDHVKFLMIKYRGMLVKQKYDDIRKTVPLDFYQTISLTLNKVNTIPNAVYAGTPYLKSVIQVPHFLNVGKLRVFPTTDYFQGEFVMVSRERLRYIGTDGYAKNMVYCAIGPDKHMYFRSSNPQFLNLASVQFMAVFDDIDEVEGIISPSIDIMESDFPIDNALLPVLINIIVKELQPAVYAPRDETNNANDDLDNSIPNQNYINAMKQQSKNNNSNE